MTIERHFLSGLSTRVVGFDDVSYLHYRRGRGLRGEVADVPPTVDLDLYLKSNERIKLSKGWPSNQSDFADAILEATSWKAVYTKP